jgi:hypothetical protein
LKSVRELPRRSATQNEAHFEGFELFRAVRPDQELDHHANWIGLVTDVERFQIEAAPFTFSLMCCRTELGTWRMLSEPTEAAKLVLSIVLSLRLERFRIVTPGECFVYPIT